MTVRKFDHRHSVGLDTGPDSNVHQSFKDECDINKIMRHYERSGELRHIRNELPRYGDFSTVTDYLTASNAVREAEQAFAKLPSGIRARFKNDPHALLSFLGDPDNLQEAISLGLVEAPIDQDEPTPNQPAGRRPATSKRPESHGNPVPIQGGEQDPLDVTVPTDTKPT